MLKPNCTKKQIVTNATDGVILKVKSGSSAKKKLGRTESADRIISGIVFRILFM